MPRLDAAEIRRQADALDPATINLLAETWGQRVPHAEFDLLRRTAPVFWHDEEDDTGFWVVTRHEDIVEISRDHELWSMEKGGFMISTQTEEDLMMMRLSILNMDPPRHDRMRRLISAGFTPRQIRHLIDQISVHATEIVDSICHKGEIDLVEEVSTHLPLMMICEMLGIPEQDYGRMKLWSDQLVGWDDPEIAVTKETQQMAAAEMFMYCNDLVAQRKTDPKDDILSTLVHADVDGDRLDEAELNLFFVTLVIAGNETTRNLISHGMLALLDHPDQMAKLQADVEALLPTTVDEMLRWGCSIQNFRRTATRDTELHGQPIKEGDKVVTFYLAGNFDEAEYDAPYEFRVDRGDNHHLAFGGGGIHFCLGSHLAKAEIAAIVRELVTRLPDMELAGRPDRLQSDFINGLKRLPVRFTPTEPVGTVHVPEHATV